MFGKSKAAYRAAFFCLKNRIKEYLEEKKELEATADAAAEATADAAADAFSPTMVMMDFEQAMREGFAEVFPSTALMGCKFHLHQAWKKQRNSMGLNPQQVRLDNFLFFF